MLDRVRDLMAEVTDLGCDLAGVRLFRVPTTSDERGSISVFSRPQWPESVQVQWNIGRSEPNVMRGVHLHLVHSDWLVVIDGQMSVGLRDLRPGSPTRGRSAMLELAAVDRSGSVGGEALYIPPGVAHGFFNRRSATHLYGTSTVWSAADELGCRWDDPALELEWPVARGVTPQLSARDAEAGTLRALLDCVGWAADPGS